MARHSEDPRQRLAQIRLAEEITRLLHGDDQLAEAQAVTAALTGETSIADLDTAALLVMREEIPNAFAHPGGSIVDLLVATGLAPSKTEARRLLGGNAISINGQKVMKEQIEERDFQNGRFLIRKGKAFKDSALIERA
jgi:tyrosyl-tRNA synthetase